MSELLRFPTETITLPSHGKYYPVGHPLRDGGGKLELKYMTAKEEDILTNTNLIQNQTVVDKLLESLVVHKGVKYTDLSTGDLTAVLIASRVLAYGKDYPVQITCDTCGEIIEHTVDLTQLETPDDLIDSDENGYHTFKTDSGKTITIKIMTRGEELQVEKDNKVLQKKLGRQIAPEVTSRLKRIIVAIDGVEEKNELSSIIDNLIVRDTRQIREEFEKINPSIDMTMEISCNNCDQLIKGGIPVGMDFLWPDAGI